ncbi:hypothetical protein DPMN_031202 [Dreissena polymorpha]|uniref:Uncharacterized protein n=1 Tax=Dreissena polymorpha TaxID=45954 RepID=A0A9D4RGW4_DREPO|nr:hypothetical protein DPMN_031202 [Dreissena polymorpha]
MINFVKSGETARRQPTQKTVILNGAIGWRMKVDLDNKLIFQSIVQTNLRQNIVLWSEEPTHHNRVECTFGNQMRGGLREEKSPSIQN